MNFERGSLFLLLKGTYDKPGGGRDISKKKKRKEARPGEGKQPQLRAFEGSKAAEK